MELQKFISLVSTGIGLVGALFLAKSFIAPTPSDILHLTSPYSRYTYAPEQITSMSAQKADAIVGVLFIILAFFGQICALIFVNDATLFVSSRWTAAWIAASCISILTVIFSLVDQKLSHCIRIETGKVAVKEYCKDNFSGENIDFGQLKSLGMMAHELLDISKRTGENNIDFIRRIYGNIGVEFPNKSDFLKKVNELKD